MGGEVGVMSGHQLMIGGNKGGQGLYKVVENRVCSILWQLFAIYRALVGALGMEVVSIGGLTRCCEGRWLLEDHANTAGPSEACL